MAILLRFSYRDRLIAGSLFVNWVNSVSCLLKLEGGLVKGFDLHFRSDRWKHNELSKIGGGSLLNSRRIVTRSRGIRSLSGSTEARLSQRGGRLTGFSSNKDEQRSVHHQHQLHQLYLENVSFSSVQGRNIYIYKKKGEEESYSNALLLALSSCILSRGKKGRKRVCIECIDSSSARRAISSKFLLTSKFTAGNLIDGGKSLYPRKLVKSVWKKKRRRRTGRRTGCAREKMRG